MTRLRATAALTAALLLPLAACAPPDDGAARVGDRPSAGAAPTVPTAPTATTAPTGSPVPPGNAAEDDDTDVDVTGDEDWPAEALATDRTDALPLPPVAQELGLGIFVNDLPETPDGPSAFRSEHSVNGAYAASVLFVGAWGDALKAGDGTEVRELSTDACTVCRRIAASVEASPLAADLLVLTRVWPFDYLAPTEDDPAPVMVLGVEHSAARPARDAGEEMQFVIQWRRLLHVAVTYSDGAWSVHDVTPEPWDGTMPPRP